LGFTSAGLPNDGRTAHYKISYDEALSTGEALANGLLAKCEEDFGWMSSLFPGVNLNFSMPLSVQIQQELKPGLYGAQWDQSSGHITLGPGAIDRTVDTLRYLLVSEVTEMFMKFQNKGWFGDDNEGSKGEGLSLFLGGKFMEAKNLIGGVPPGNYMVTFRWLSSDERPNFVLVLLT
jgi:hypothetical protein